MEKLIIIGSGGFAKEVAWLVERINKKVPTWELLGFTEQNEELHGKIINSYKVLGADECIGNYGDVYLVCAVGAAKLRKKIIEKIKEQYPMLKFATLVDPTVECSEYVSIGEGTIICAGTIITVNIEIGSHVIINLDCTIGHDSVLEDFVTVNPSVNISGNVSIGEGVEIGTGVQVIQEKTIGAFSTIGAGAVVTKDIENNCVAVGIPAKKIKSHDK